MPRSYCHENAIRNKSMRLWINFKALYRSSRYIDDNGAQFPLWPLNIDLLGVLWFDSDVTAAVIAPILICVPPHTACIPSWFRKKGREGDKGPGDGEAEPVVIDRRVQQQHPRFWKMCVRRGEKLSAARNAAIAHWEVTPVAGAENPTLRVKIWRLESVIHTTQSSALRLPPLSCSLLFEKKASENRQHVACNKNQRVRVFGGGLKDYLEHLKVLS